MDNTAFEHIHLSTTLTCPFRKIPKVTKIFKKYFDEPLYWMHYCEADFYSTEQCADYIVDMVTAGVEVLIVSEDYQPVTPCSLSVYSLPSSDDTTVSRAFCLLKACGGDFNKSDIVRLEEHGTPLVLSFLNENEYNHAYMLLSSLGFRVSGDKHVQSYSDKKPPDITLSISSAEYRYICSHHKLTEAK